MASAEHKPISSDLGVRRNAGCGASGSGHSTRPIPRARRLSPTSPPFPPPLPLPLPHLCVTLSNPVGVSRRPHTLPPPFALPAPTARPPPVPARWPRPDRAMPRCPGRAALRAPGQARSRPVNVARGWIKGPGVGFTPPTCALKVFGLASG